MLERLQVRNFQKHELQRIHFAQPGVTTFVGDNDAGKSAIFRALYWLCFNRPSKDSYRRRISDNVFVDEDTEVTLWVDGHKVVRRRGDTVNEYELDGQLYKALGREVPEPIANLLNVGEVNFQDQHDSLFWLSDSAAAASARLNAVVNLSVMDDTLENLRARQRKAKLSVEASQAMLTMAQETKASLSFVAPFADAYDELEALFTAADQKFTDVCDVRTLVNGAQRHRQNAAIAATFAGAAAKLAQQAMVAHNRGQRAADLRRLVVKAQTARAAKPPKATLTTSAALFDKYRQKRLRIETIKALIDKAEREARRMRGAAETVKEASSQVEEYRKKLGDLCPVCGKPLEK